MLAAISPKPESIELVRAAMQRVRNRFEEAEIVPEVKMEEI